MRTRRLLREVSILINAIYPIIGNQSSLPFYLTGIGVSAPEYHIVRESGLVSHQLCFTAYGRGILKVGGNSYVQTAGSFFYLSPGIQHEYYPDGGSWTTCWTVFRGDYLAPQMRALGFGDYAVKGGCTEHIKQIFSQLLAAANNPVSGAERCSGLIYEYILAARGLLLSEGQPDESSPAAKGISFMEEHYGEDITLESLAALSGVSLQHFCRLFRARTGMRPMEYLARKRISSAKLLLWNTSEPIAVIGERCGYPDPAYFGAVFKKYEGISPREYRLFKGSAVI